jgi:glycosyltransferase involved in cell wall biosynthesis
MCPPGSFYRDGHVCTECLDRRSALPSLKHGCYRGSRSQTLPLALSTRFAGDPVLARAERVITLTDDMRELYARAGVPASRIDVVANFIPSADVPLVGPGGDYWVYAGRLSPEKGVLELVEHWPAGRRLVVAGSGPLEQEVISAAGRDVEVVGRLTRPRIRALLAGAVGLLFPSRWLEGLGLVALEALAVGTPVMAWWPAPAAVLVKELGVGLVGHEDLATSLDEAEEQFPLLRRRCREVFDSHFTEQVWAETILAVYDRAKACSRSHEQ